MAGVAWVGPLGSRGGYGNVARNYVRGLVEAGVPVSMHSTAPVDPDIGARDAELLAGLPQGILPDADIAVVHSHPGDFPTLVPTVRNAWEGPVAVCTIGETDRIPSDWAAGCNLADEVWLPTTFNLLTFGRSGVDVAKMRMVPYGMDPSGLEPDGPVDGTVAPDDHFVFLYTFAFDWRKGFDLLLEAYMTEFTREDKVTLVLKVYDPDGDPVSVRSRIIGSIADSVDLFSQELPRVVLMDQPLERDALMALYRRADLYVSTDRANGWGMPCMEVMTMGGAAATIDWSGSTEFMRADNALLIPAQPSLVPVDPRLSALRPMYAGQSWADVRIEDVRSALRAAFAGDVDVKALGAAAREEILDRWTVRTSADWILGRESGAYTPPAGLVERLRPLVGLEAVSPLQDARANVLALAVIGDWTAGLQAFAEAFGPDDDVTLALWADPTGPPSDAHERVLAAFEALGLDDAKMGDMLLVGGSPEEALVDDRVRGFIGSAAWWPLAEGVEPEAAALRAALDRRSVVPLRSVAGR
jgi:glycosyltransferase involved in cell wall biosynthesis